ncbi:MAG: helix-turn-helix transcriptional regulator [Akkermansiaceae bacterium]|nr:helix-turn-helix transcriptional regulator [Akkermansiaceae bacterium]
MDFPTRFRTARNRTGLSRLKAAKLIGVNRETVGRWESGKRHPEISKLKKIHEILGADALPHTNNDLPGRMKLFRMKMGYQIRKASGLVKKNQCWWIQVEGGELSLSDIEKQTLVEILYNEECRVTSS